MRQNVKYSLNVIRMTKSTDIQKRTIIVVGQRGNMMNDLISRQAAIDAFGLSERTRKYGGDHSGYDTRMLYEIQDVLENLPPAVPERKKGKWNAYYHGVNENPSFTYSCNQCGYSAPYGLYGGSYSQKKWMFCPNCGADMRGDQDETD